VLDAAVMAAMAASTMTEIDAANSTDE